MTQMLQPEFDLLDPNNPTQDDLVEIRRLLLADLRGLKLEKIELTASAFSIFLRRSKNAS